MKKSNKNKQTLKFAEIKGHFTSINNNSYKYLKLPLPVIFHRWADYCNEIEGKTFNTTYGIFEDMLGQIYTVLPNHVRFTGDVDVN